MSISADLISKIVQSLIGLNIYKIILFGSYARGTATEDSDIDLVVILDSDEMSQLFNDRMARRRPVSRSLLEIKIGLKIINSPSRFSRQNIICAE